jgi:hypothetical protein
MMTKPTFQEWFCLRDERRNFEIDPVHDQEFLFGEATWEEDIDSRLKRAQLLGTPVRLVWWGQYGIGKTHRLRHTEYVIKHNGYSYYPCYVVASDIDEKSGFERLHVELVNGLGREQMHALAKAYRLDLDNGTAGVAPFQEICGTSPDVASALKKFATSDDDRELLPAWRFLCGMKLKGTDPVVANVTKEALDTSNDFAGVISAFGTIIKTKTPGNAELLYLIDEGENLGKVTKAVLEARWGESVRAILDLKHVGIVMTIGAERQDGIPKIVLQPDIVRRFQRDNYIQMEAYKPPVARNFVRSLLGNWIDPDRRSKLESEMNFSSAVADYDPDLYPFTAGSFDKFCEWAVVDPRTAKPSEIIARLNNVAAEAYFRDRHLITRDHLTDMGIA